MDLITALWGLAITWIALDSSREVRRLTWGEFLRFYKVSAWLDKAGL